MGATNDRILQYRHGRSTKEDEGNEPEQGWFRYWFGRNLGAPNSSTTQEPVQETMRRPSMPVCSISSIVNSKTIDVIIR